MSQYKKYYGKGLRIKYFPDHRTILLALSDKDSATKSELRQFKEKINIFLNVESSNFERDENGKYMFTVNLRKDTPPEQIDEFLRQLFHGGDEVVNAADLAKDEEEEEEEQPSPQQGMNPQGGEMQQPMMMAHAVPKFSFYSFFLESTYRTGKYWDAIAKARGKGKQSLTEKDVLFLRKQYSKKPKGKRRDEVLRSLDKAMKYFARRIKKEQGDQAANSFKEKYRSIGDLIPRDYKEEQPGEHVSRAEAGPTQFEPGAAPTGEMGSEEMKNAMDFSDFFSMEDEEDEEDAYEGFETKE